MISINPKSCSACLACMNACPRDAIADALDEDGFLLPVVDEKRCVDCGLCERVCAATQPPELAAPSAANLFVHNDRDVLRNSTSGGAFTALSDCALAQNGAVVGAMMDEKLAIRHAVAESTGQRDRMRGSLYVQSDPNFVYRDVKALLEKGRFVLFVGTPCQVYGLKRFLNRKYDNLILVDFLCHGVPSASLLRAHIAWLEKLYRRQAKSYSFRSKKFGWRPAAIEEIVFQDGVRKSALPVQAYNKFFHNNVSLRASCLTCPFRRAERCSDLTVGDFWGVAKICGEKLRRGASLVLVNSPEGESFLKRASQAGRLKNVPIEKILYRVAPPKPRVKGDRDAFWKLYREQGYPALVDNYAKRSKKERILYYWKRLVKIMIAKLLG